jgi:hypothetical protein
MNNIVRRYAVTAFFAASAFLLNNCAVSSKALSVWDDDSYQRGNIGKVLVIALQPQEYQRRGMEYYLKKKLEAEKVSAVASVEIFPDKQKLNKDTLKAYIEDKGFDAVLVVGFRAVKEKMNPNIYEGARPTNIHIYVGFYGYYYNAYDYSYSAFTVKERNILIESTLFDAKSAKAVWKSIFQTSNPENIINVMNSVSDFVVYDLADKGYFRK